MRSSLQCAQDSAWHLKMSNACWLLLPYWFALWIFTAEAQAKKEDIGIGQSRRLQRLPKSLFLPDESKAPSSCFMSPTLGPLSWEVWEMSHPSNPYLSSNSALCFSHHELSWAASKTRRLGLTQKGGWKSSAVPGIPPDWTELVEMFYLWK